MSKAPYEFDHGKSSFFSKFGSAAIALGSVAAAVTVAVPSVGAFVGLGAVTAQEASTTSTIQSGSQQTIANADEFQAPSALPTSAEPAPAVQANSVTVEPPQIQLQAVALPTSGLSASDPSTSELPATDPLAANDPLASSGGGANDVGNISSPTPGSAAYGSATGSGNGATAANSGAKSTTETGGVSSPTPYAAGGYSDDDHDDHDDDDDDDDDHDDDHDDD
jgi:hypothetical protein